MPDSAPASAPAGVAAGTTAPRIDIQRSGSYDTVAALVADSNLVVYATATSAHSVATVNGLPFTSTIMHIDRVIRGIAPKTDTLSLRQVGPADIADAPKIVEQGHQYLLFLGRRLLQPGDDHGRVVRMVGLMAGLYEVAGGNAIRLDNASPLLPTDIAVGKLESAINAAAAPQP